MKSKKSEIWLASFLGFIFRFRDLSFLIGSPVYLDFRYAPTGYSGLSKKVTEDHPADGGHYHHQANKGHRLLGAHDTADHQHVGQT